MSYDANPRRGLEQRWRWAAPGDVGAFLGLTFDNVAQLIIFTTILIGVFDFPPELVIGRMLPGTAFGVLVGDLIYTWLAFRLARRTGREDVTAMPLGIDTVSLFGLTFGILGPVAVRTGDPELAWQVGMATMLFMGVFKLAVTPFAEHLRRLVPPAAMLGTIGGIGAGLIAFMPLLKLDTAAMIALPALFCGLQALLRPPRLVARIPPVLAVVVVATAAFYLLRAAGLLDHTTPAGMSRVTVGLALPWPTLGFVRGIPLAIESLAISLPLAFATVIGGIDNTESAAAAGDVYDTRSILATEAISTFVASLVGGVIQTTPYIGHPAYKRMGGRAGYTLATALFVGLGGMLGYLSWLVDMLPEVVVAPILVFIGLEIASSAFHAVPARHAPAVAICFLPVIANVVAIIVGQVMAGAGIDPASLSGPAAESVRAVSILSSGFVFTSMLWGAALAFLIDGRFGGAAITFATAVPAAWFGVIHSSLPGGKAFLPWRVADPLPMQLAAGYGTLCALAIVGVLVQRWRNARGS